MPLSDKQIRHLRGLGHHIKPVVWIGQHGIKDSIIEELEFALDTHELIKVKIVADKTDRIAHIATIAEKTAAELIQHIGQMAIFFRRNKKKPKIALPSA